MGEGISRHLKENIIFIILVPGVSKATDAPSMIAGRGHSRKSSKDLDEIDEHDDVSFVYT